MTMEHYIALGASFIDMDDTLEHYGVKGMKWGRNKTEQSRLKLRYLTDNIQSSGSKEEVEVKPIVTVEQKLSMFRHNVNRNVFNRKPKGVAEKALRNFQTEMRTNLFKRKSKISVRNSLDAFSSKMKNTLFKNVSSNTSANNSRRRKAEDLLDSIFYETNRKKPRLK